MTRILQAKVARSASRLLAIAFVLAGAACGTTPLRLVARHGVQPALSVPSARQRMATLALQEWAIFGRPVVAEGPPPALEFPGDATATSESDPDKLARVLLYWYTVSREAVFGNQGELRAWSAAFVSWVAQGAGLTPEQLRPGVLHWDYIAQALHNDAANGLHARDAKTTPVRPGDLLCAPRGEEFTKLVADFGSLRRGTYHCEVVVSATGGVVASIGGNVLDAVALTRGPLDAQGRALPTARRPWRVVLVLEP